MDGGLISIQRVSSCIKQKHEGRRSHWARQQTATQNTLAFLLQCSSIQHTNTNTWLVLYISLLNRRPVKHWSGVVLFTDVSSCPIWAVCAQVCLIHSDKLRTEPQSKVSLRLWWHLLMIFERDFTDKNHIAEIIYRKHRCVRVVCSVVFSTWLSTMADVHCSDDRVGT